MTDSSNEIYRGVVVEIGRNGLWKEHKGKAYKNAAPAKAWVTRWRNLYPKRFHMGFVERAVKWEKIE